MPIQKIRAADLVKLYSELLRTGSHKDGHKGGPLAPKSVTYVHIVLGRVLGHAAAWGVITTNVATLVSPPASRKDEEIEILTQDQIGALLRHLDGHMLRPIVSSCSAPAVVAARLWGCAGGISTLTEASFESSARSSRPGPGYGSKRRKRGPGGATSPSRHG